MAKAGPDVYGGENQGGYASDNSTIYGFSHMHDSGTGGKPANLAHPTSPAEDHRFRIPRQLPYLCTSRLSQR